MLHTFRIHFTHDIPVLKERSISAKQVHLFPFVRGLVRQKCKLTMHMARRESACGQLKMGGAGGQDKRD